MRSADAASNPRTPSLLKKLTRPLPDMSDAPTFNRFVLACNPSHSPASGSRNPPQKTVQGAERASQLVLPCSMKSLQASPSLRRRRRRSVPAIASVVVAHRRGSRLVRCSPRPVRSHIYIYPPSPCAPSSAPPPSAELGPARWGMHPVHVLTAWRPRGSVSCAMRLAATTATHSMHTRP